MSFKAMVKELKMDIRITPNINTKQNYNNNNNPKFTAMLKGSAVRSAIQFSKDTFQLGEVSEILENISKIGDKYTVIDCSYDGLVKITNSKLGRTAYQTKLTKNESSNNSYLEMLRSFNSKSSINKYENGLINRIFSHSKNKQGLYDMLRTYNFAPTTRVLVELEAARYPEINRQKEVEFIFNKVDLEKMREYLLNTLKSHF